MPSDIVNVDFPQALREQFDRSDLRRRAKTDPEAIRNAIAKVLDAERPRRRGKRTPAISRTRTAHMVTAQTIRTEAGEDDRQTPKSR